MGYYSAQCNTGNGVLALGTCAGIGNGISSATILSNGVLPSYANAGAAATAINVGTGGVVGNTYLYYDIALATISAIRL